jgi:hypothetical protein
MPIPTPVPTVGARGVFTILAPFAALMPAASISNSSVAVQPRMTCVAVRSLTELVASGNNPQADDYTANGLDATVYQTDLNNGVVIVTLQADDGMLVQVPSSYIGSYADPNGVPYQVMLLSVNLGALPSNVDLSFVSQQVVEVIQDSLGVTTTAKIQIVSNTAMMSQADSAQIETARTASITNSTTAQSKVLSLQAQVALLTGENQTLSAYIVAHGMAQPVAPPSGP